MRLAFDLDNTLIRGSYNFPLETPKRKLWARLLRKESLRAGIIELCDYCQHHNWEIWVYTTSYRSPWYIRRLFWLHGIRLAGVVNQARHDREVTVRCSKYPPQFGIHLLIDDAPGVQVEAERHGFEMLLVAPVDAQWVAKVRAAVTKISDGCNAAG